MTKGLVLAGGGATGRSLTVSPFTIRKATGDRFMPAPPPPPKALSSSGFWFLVVKSLPPEAKPTLSLETGMIVTPSA